jgi:hypothetical protein
MSTRRVAACLLLALGAGAFVYNAPLILVARLARNRIGHLVCRSLIAIGCAVSTGYWLWRLDRYDVWRHGAPSARHLLSVHAPQVLISADLTTDR